MVIFCACLVGMGHSKIAYIDYPQGLAQAVFCGEGCQNALRKHGLPFISGGCETTTKDAHRLLQKLLAEHPDLTALVTPNEAGLPGMYQAIWDAGKNIPTDFSVISLASPQRAERLMPTLSTMDFSIEEMGRFVMGFVGAAGARTAWRMVRPPFLPTQ